MLPISLTKLIKKKKKGACSSSLSSPHYHSTTRIFNSFDSWFWGESNFTLPIQGFWSSCFGFHAKLQNVPHNKPAVCEVPNFSNFVTLMLSDHYDFVGVVLFLGQSLLLSLQTMEENATGEELLSSAHVGNVFLSLDFRCIQYPLIPQL